MSWVEIFGLAAGIFTTGGATPQAWRLFRRKSARDISLPSSFMFLAGTLLWLAYGIALKSPAMMFWNSVGTVVTGAILFAKFRWGRD